MKYTRDEECEGGERSLDLAKRKPFEVSEGSVSEELWAWNLHNRGLKEALDEQEKEAVSAD